MSTPFVVAGMLLAHGLATEPRPDAIFGGTPTTACEWPTVVRVGQCSGLLVHPEIVVTAAHCPDVDEVVFGIDDDEAEHVAVVACGDTGMHAPGEGLDLGWCRLAEPRDDLVLVPPLVGDDASVLQPGRTVRIVGFGLTEDSTFGVQHVVETTLVEVDGDYVKLGGDGRDSCIGDSGAPAFVELGPGRWHAFALTSYGPVPCGAGGWYTRIDRGMPWLETATGVDLTPCHDADGRRDPDARCGAPTAADVARSCEATQHDDAATGCATAPARGASAFFAGVIALLARRRR